MNPTVDSPSALLLQQLLGQALPALLERQGWLLTIKDADNGRYLHTSPGIAELLGQGDRNWLGRADAEIFDATVLAALRAAEHTVLAQGAVLESSHGLEINGSRREYTVLRLVCGTSPRCIVALWQDRAAQRQREQQLRQALAQIEQQQQANDKLRREITDQALRDPATGLHRRAHFEDQLKRELDLSMREHREFSVVFIELDTLSPTVLALGGAGETAVLEAMGRLLRGGTRAMDASCRFDERRFAVLLSGVGLATAHARMEGLRRKCATQIVVHQGQELGFTVAVGVASYPHTAATQEALLLACEAALAEAQRRGGNHVTLAAIRFEPA
jgi:diguanylate cyclase (GGDEF)-like protein